MFITRARFMGYTFIMVVIDDPIKDGFKNAATFLIVRLSHSLIIDPFVWASGISFVLLCNLCRNSVIGVPKGIRTPVIAVKGRCPRPG